MGIAVNDSKLVELARLIAAWPGLVSGPPENLIADCLVLVEHLGDAARVIDVGSGAGLPGLPLKIARPELSVTLLEADGRKASFLVQACAQLGLRGIDVVNRRAEDAGHADLMRERFDVAGARALGPMSGPAGLFPPLAGGGGGRAGGASGAGAPPARAGRGRVAFIDPPVRPPPRPNTPAVEARSSWGPANPAC